jgi:catechol 2,3-dioxygenase-like lactoylglutathione lyase family enzyme
MLRLIRNLDYVVLLCADMERMRDSYHDVLGLPIHRDLDGWLEMPVGGAF